MTEQEVVKWKGTLGEIAGGTITRRKQGDQEPISYACVHMHRVQETNVCIQM